MKTKYDNLLNEANTALRFRKFKTENNVQKLVASIPDDQARGEWELHTLEDMRWNEHHQRSINYWSRDMIKRIRWLICQPAYA